MILRACVTCGSPCSDGYCSDHRPKPWATSRRRKRITVSGWEEHRRRQRVLDRYTIDGSPACHYCGRGGADTVDHVIPLAEGGADDESNMALIHAAPCHQEKTRRESRRARA